MSDKELKDFRLLRKTAKDEYEKAAKILEKLVNGGANSGVFTKSQHSRLLGFSTNKSIYGRTKFLGFPIQSAEEKAILDISDYTGTAEYLRDSKKWKLDLTVCGTHSEALISCEKTQGARRLKLLLLDTLASLVSSGKVAFDGEKLNKLIAEEERITEEQTDNDPFEE